MKKTDRLLVRLVALGKIPKHKAKHYAFRRTYHGYYQKAVGGWSWILESNCHGEEAFGSPYAVTELLKHKEWKFDLLDGSDFEININ